MIFKYKIFLLPLLLAILINCSVDKIAGGNGSETTNGIISLINKDGSNASNTSVTLIPSDFNPVTDLLLESMTKTTDSEGQCTFTLQDSVVYNIQAVHIQKRTRFLVTNIQGESQKESIYINGTLNDIGTINILMPDTVDTINGNLYFNGTKIKKTFSSGFSKVGGYYSFTFDSVPTSEELPQLLYCEWPQGGPPISITNALSLNPLDTISLAFSDNRIKPVWRFSFTIAVKDVVADYHNGMENIRPLIEEWVSKSTAKFNKTDHFDAVFHFAIDSLYEYTGDLFTEGLKPMGRFDFRLLYSDDLTKTRDAQQSLDDIYRTRFIYLYGTPDEYFANWDKDILAGLFAQTRGCFQLDWLTIDSTKNYVNNTGYESIESILNEPVGTDMWDDYSINVLNYNKNELLNEVDILHKAFPNQMGVIVSDTSGAVSSALINVYVSEFNTQTINSQPLLSGGTTDNNGKYLFTDNPFKPYGSNTAENGIALIEVVYNADTAYSWFPINEAGNAWFENSDTTLYKEISF